MSLTEVILLCCVISWKRPYFFTVHSYFLLVFRGGWSGLFGGKPATSFARKKILILLCWLDTFLY